MIDFELKEINEIILDKICKQYLTPFEEDFVWLALKGRRTKEISVLLNTPPCEVVRRRKVISRKIRAIYTYHFKLDAFEFLRFAVLYLEPIKFKCLLLHVWELKPLKDISKEFKIQPSTAQRWLQSSKNKLCGEFKEDEVSDLHSYLGCFDDLPYLNIHSIRRTKEEVKKYGNMQIGNKTLRQWLEAKVG